MIRRAITGIVVTVVVIAGLAAWRLNAQTPVPIHDPLDVYQVAVGGRLLRTEHPEQRGRLSRGLGWCFDAMVGGLIVSRILTLFTTRVIYIYMDELVGLMARLRGRRQVPAVTVAAE